MNEGGHARLKLAIWLVSALPTRVLHELLHITASCTSQRFAQPDILAKLLPCTLLQLINDGTGSHMTSFQYHHT